MPWATPFSMPCQGLPLRWLCNCYIYPGPWNSLHKWTPIPCRSGNLFCGVSWFDQGKQGSFLSFWKLEIGVCRLLVLLQIKLKLGSIQIGWLSFDGKVNCPRSSHITFAPRIHRSVGISSCCRTIFSSFFLA